MVEQGKGDELREPSHYSTPFLRTLCSRRRQADLRFSRLWWYGVGPAAQGVTPNGVCRAAEAPAGGLLLQLVV